tara:strand:+ start:16 stop:228 length:213 start_codon:yes stop_codon:yes gene_type:complete
MNNITIKTKIENILEIIDEIKENEKMNENNYVNLCNLLKDIYNLTQTNTSIKNHILDFIFIYTNNHEFIG